MANQNNETVNLGSHVAEQKITSPFKRYSNGSPFKSTVGFQWRILLRVLFLFITLSTASFFFVKQWHLYLALLSPLVIYQLVELIRFQKKTHEELNEFVEAIHYRDFSRYFDVKHAPADIQSLRRVLTRSIPHLKSSAKKKKHNTNTCKKYWNLSIPVFFLTKWKPVKLYG